MEILIAIGLIAILLGVLLVVSVVLYALVRSVFSGQNRTEKGILAAILAILLFD